MKISECKALKIVLWLKKKKLKVTENGLSRPPRRGTRILILLKVFPKGEPVWIAANAFNKKLVSKILIWVQ